MTATTFIVPGRPATKGSTVSFFAKRSHRIVTKTDSAIGKAWAKDVAWIAQQAGVEKVPKGQGVAIIVIYEFPWPQRATLRLAPCVRPDCDKLARALLDALTGIAYDDDGQVVSLTVHKRYGLELVAKVWVGPA
jgi:crossover junction endodeoxyribonuclease RusA